MLIFMTVFGLVFGFVLGCGIIKVRNCKNVPGIFILLPLVFSLIYFAVFLGIGLKFEDILFPENLSGMTKTAYSFILTLWSNLMTIFVMKQFPMTARSVASVAFGKHLDR